MLAGASGALATALFMAAASGQQASDRTVTEQILAEIDGLPEAERAPTRAPVAEAKRALERAAGARAGGDAKHGERLEGLAREWAETARDLLRAIGAEADAGALQLATADASTQGERARALLEEAIARRGRAEAELARVTGLADGGMPMPEQAPEVPEKGKAARGGKSKSATGAKRGSR
jgi:hypothetical protein